jgi:DNA repair protein RadD
MAIELRYCQQDMLDEASTLLRRGVKTILLQAPTGFGKTVLAGHMLKTASERNFSSWFIVHRRELVKQSSATFNRFGINHGIVAAGFDGSRFRPVQVCGLQTLARRYRQLAPPGFVVWDEAHHIAAGSWAEIHRAFPDAVHIGLSATPQRLDGTGLRSFFSEIVHGPSIAQLIDDGFLSDYRMYRPGGLNLDGVHQVAGDFNKKELENALNNSTVTGDAIAHYFKYALGRRAIMFEASIARSQNAVAKFKAAGVSAEHVDGDTDPAVRDAAMARFIAGHTLVLSNVDLFGEGVDVPAVEALIDCAPTMSLTRCMQRWGRVLRPAEGKDYAVILDHAGNSKRHGLPDDDREWSLDGTRKAKKPKDADDISIKACPMCFSVVRSHVGECKHCGHIFMKASRTIEEQAGELQEVDREAARREQKAQQAQAATLEDLIHIGTLRGYKRPELWARHVFRARQSRRAA